MSVIRKTIASTLLFFFFVIFSHALGNDINSDTGRFTIVVGSELDYPPYASVTAKGEADGFSVDLMKAVCEVMNIDLTFRIGPWSVVRTALEKGELDALPLVAYSKERDQIFDFTAPHTVAHGVVFKRLDRPAINLMSDLRDKSILVMRSDSGHDWLVRNDISDNLFLTATVEESLRLLSQGRADYALAPRLVGLLTAKKLKLENIETTGPLLDAYGRGYGFAVKDGNFSLLAQLNEGLSIIKNNGRYNEIYEKWFGEVDPRGVSSNIIYKYAILSLCGISIFLLFVFIWIRILHRTVDRQTLELIHARDSLEEIVRDRTEELRSEIAKRGQIEEDLRQRGALLDAIIEHAPAIILVKDLEGRYLLVNPLFLEWNATTLERAIGRTFEDLPSNAPAERILSHDQEVIQTRKAVIREIEHTFPGGVHRDSYQVKFPILDKQGNLISVGGIALDITALKDAERHLLEATRQAEAANHAKSEFLANMSHELRTPLNSILGFSEVMFEQVFGPLGSARYIEYARDIHDSGRLLLQIIGDILDLSRIEAGVATLDEEILVLHEIVESVARILRPRAAERRIRFAIDLPHDLPRLKADPTRLKQILLNIGSNAVKFTGNQGRINVTAKLDDHGGITIIVSDTGVGMTEAEMRVALQPFGQVQSAYSRGQQGTGLGLPIAKSFVELHGGVLEISSNPGHGTTVEIHWPPDRTVVADMISAAVIPPANATMQGQDQPSVIAS